MTQAVNVLFSKPSIPPSSFGFAMADRTRGSEKYRFGFNGQEKDDEVKGEGNSYTTFFREADTRLAIWWGLDPESRKFAYCSPYSFMGNNPLMFTDKRGNSIKPTNDVAEKKTEDYMSSFDQKNKKGNTISAKKDLFGVVVGKNDVLTSNLNLNEKQFKERAVDFGLKGEQITDALNFYAALRTKYTVYEIGGVSIENGDQSYPDKRQSDLANARGSNKTSFSNDPQSLRSRYPSYSSAIKNCRTNGDFGPNQTPNSGPVVIDNNNIQLLCGKGWKEYTPKDDSESPYTYQNGDFSYQQETSLYIFNSTISNKKFFSEIFKDLGQYLPIHMKNEE